MSSAIALRRSDVAAPKHETIILRRPSASSSDGPEPPFALIAAFLVALRRCHHTQLDAFFVLVLVVTSVTSVSFVSGCFNSDN